AQALRYTVVERSRALRVRLSATLGEHIASGSAVIVERLDELVPAENAIIFANEFFDALPVDVISERGELRIATAPNGGFAEQWAPLQRTNRDFVINYGAPAPPGSRTEVAPAYREYMNALAPLMQRGFAVIIDYGYTRDELLAGRHFDTVTAYRNHRVSASAYEAPGEQDITAHVNFTAVAEMARAVGFTPQPLVTQSQFLLGIGE